MYNVYDLRPAELNLLDELTVALSTQLSSTSIRRELHDREEGLIEITLQTGQRIKLRIEADLVICITIDLQIGESSEMVVFSGQRIAPYGDDLHYEFEYIDVSSTLPDEQPELFTVLQLFNSLTSNSLEQGIKEVFEKVATHWHIRD